MEATTTMEATAATALGKNIAEVAFEQGRRHTGDPNICAVGYGVKLRKGNPTGHTAVVFYVRKKLQSAGEIAEKGTSAVSASVDGFATDVVEIGHLAEASADRALPAGTRGVRIDDPLIGGAATMGLGASLAGPGGYGSLGGLCFDSATNAPLILSNAHVWGTTAGTEVAQPVMPAAILGAQASPAVTGQTPQLVQTRIPPALSTPVVFANAVAQTYLITGCDSDPLQFGQEATSVTAGTRTDIEQVTIKAPVAGLAPAGRRFSPSVEWIYRRISTSSVVQASSNAPRTPTRLLAARRLFTNAASYSSGQIVTLYAEIVPAADGGPASPSAHFPLVLLYPMPAGDRRIPRVLKPSAKQTPPTVTVQFTGFPSPAKANAVAVLPVTLSCGIGLDCDQTGTYKSIAGLPAGTFALQLPSTESTSPVRIFVPPSTSMIIDIDPNGLPTLEAQGVNSAGDTVGTVSTANGAGTRKLVTISGPEIVEVRLTGAGSMALCGVTSTRKPNIEASPLQYAGNINVSDLAKGRWGASLFVQALDSGVTESANVIERAIGAQALIADCQFDVT